MKNIMFIAPPAAGKGTQSRLVSEKYHIPHISSSRFKTKKYFKNFKISLDFYKNICYNLIVCWRDGRVGLRRTTGNRVNPNTVSRVRIPFSPP